MLSRTAEYALRAVLFLADRGEPTNVDLIAERLGVPRNYLSKTLHRLAREGVLTSTRGQGGGFRLVNLATGDDTTRAGSCARGWPTRGTRRRSCCRSCWPD